MLQKRLQASLYPLLLVAPQAQAPASKLPKQVAHLPPPKAVGWAQRAGCNQRVGKCPTQLQNHCFARHFQGNRMALKVVRGVIQKSIRDGKGSKTQRRTARKRSRRVCKALFPGPCMQDARKRRAEHSAGGDFHV